MDSVALLAEGVDRNVLRLGDAEKGRHVALLAEGVDRNTTANTSPLTSHVALLAEGVDRNRLAMIVALPASSRPPRGGRG